MLILDPSFLAAAYNTEDALHQKAEEMAILHDREKIALNDFIIDELATVLLNRNGHKSANIALDALFDNDDVSIKHTTEDEFYEIAEYFKAQKTKLSFTDCSIVLLAKKSGAKVVTFDRKLQHALSKQELFLES